MLNNHCFAEINESIGPCGLIGLDKLYSHMITSELNALITSLHTKFTKEKVWIDLLQTLYNDLEPLSVAIPNPAKLYASLSNKCVKVWPTILDNILQIGQKQIIRKHIAHELNTSCQFKSQQLHASMKTMNEWVQMNYRLMFCNLISNPLFSDLSYTKEGYIKLTHSISHRAPSYYANWTPIWNGQASTIRITKYMWRPRMTTNLRSSYSYLLWAIYRSCNMCGICPLSPAAKPNKSMGPHLCLASPPCWSNSISIFCICLSNTRRSTWFHLPRITYRKLNRGRL